MSTTYVFTFGGGGCSSYLFFFDYFRKQGRRCYGGQVSSQAAGKQGNSFAWPNSPAISSSWFFLSFDFPFLFRFSIIVGRHGVYPDTDTSCIRTANHYTGGNNPTWTHNGFHFRPMTPSF
ncbi:hypothetical protein LX32DRAFT_5043 [Colletotrichum zoysiae]|uniref:Uncharacterized protein n=1 Tax=Colletotrichum zoysiae TaxID=1216348 RepID=A0AAD9M5C6_9PEZI|nr:hypothetical protein LX32DRAFT_5043 [Colletotrichum zoysiae]